MRHFFAACTVVVLINAFNPKVAASQTFTYTTIDMPGAARTTALGINDRSQIVGFFSDGANTEHAFLRSNGVFTVIDVPGAASTIATGINNNGQIVGSYVNPQGPDVGFVLFQGQLTSITVPGAVSTMPVGINDLGQIVGSYIDAQFSQHGFVWTYGQFVTVDIPNWRGGLVSGINRSGQIVGVYTDSTNELLSFRDDPGGHLAPVVFPGVPGTAALGINDHDQIVGSWVVSPATVRGVQGFLQAVGLFTTIDVPGSTYTNAQGVNNRGQIVGAFTARPTNLRDHAFLATPAGEVEDVSGRPSEDGTRVPLVTSVVDASLTTWTIGPGQQILHDGEQAAGGYGSQILWYGQEVYVLGDDGNWWKWTGNTWGLAGPNDPSL